MSNVKKFFRNLFGVSSAARRAPDDPKRYRIQKKIGRGGFGIVFEAKDRVTNDIVAIKKVRIGEDGNAEHELKYNLALWHKNVVRLLGHYREKRQEKDYDRKLEVMDMCLVLEYTRTSLRDCIDEFRKRGKFLPNQIIMVMTFQMYRGLHYLHSLGIIHRDIKPSNLLVNKKTLVLKISDLGSAMQMVPGEPRDTRVCSTSYRAPELELANEDYNEKIDIWSSGCVLAECFTGEILFREVRNVPQYDRIRDLMGDPTPWDIAELQPLITEPPTARHPSTFDQRFARFKPRVPDTGLAMIKKCLTYRPSLRPSAFELCADPFYDEMRQSATCDAILYDFMEEELTEVPAELLERVVPSRAYNAAVWKKLSEGRLYEHTWMLAKTAIGADSFVSMSAFGEDPKKGD